MGQRRGMVKLFGKTIEVVEGDGGGEYKILRSGTQGRDRESTGSEERGRRRGPTDDRSPSSSAAGHRSSTAKASKFDCNVKEEDRDGDDVDSNYRTLKKPEKILPCPRCNSEDTKFCYFNNYNVNQPRYFCRNCQRYWTAGGSMRKIPVGAGRRKNKSSAADAAINYRHVTITPASATGLRSSSVQSLIPYQANGNAGGSVTSIGGGRNIADGDEKSCGSSSITASNSVEDGIGVQGYGYPIGGTPWIYPWNHNQTPPSNILANTLFPATPTPPSPLGFAVHSSWNPQQQQQPWLISSQFSQPKSSLGKKHSRDGYILNHGNNIKINSTKDGETKCLWIPNTMRIEDLSEVAKSSMWLRMGAEKWKDTGFSKGGALFKLIKPMEKALDASDLLHPNPAALSRSQCFHEST